jgi:aspartyl/glutamyl-tRNA(Asn/Gln) amidotransferase C subunit
MTDEIDPVRSSPPQRPSGRASAGATSNGVDVRALASLARLEVSDEELAMLEREIPDILKFVETIQNVPGKITALSPESINVMRADDNPHEGGVYTEALLKAAPARVGNRVAVKQVLKRK